MHLGAAVGGGHAGRGPRVKDEDLLPPEGDVLAFVPPPLRLLDASVQGSCQLEKVEVDHLLLLVLLLVQPAWREGRSRGVQLESDRLLLLLLLVQPAWREGRGRGVQLEGARLPLLPLVRLLLLLLFCVKGLELLEGVQLSAQSPHLGGQPPENGGVASHGGTTEPCPAPQGQKTQWPCARCGGPGGALRAVRRTWRLQRP
mmetsp:Transcript_37217/g.114699  ORF Transcript_37217/g.114699 Transcript_37217/m.114699 type:complete len:201 (-) Transcript_37217:28-630(-)